jgi:diphthine-ammonia ligase
MANCCYEKIRAVVSFTGGKDCHLALCRAYEREDLDIVGLVCFNPPGDVTFKAHPVTIQRLQAECLNLPLIMCEVNAALCNNDYRHAYAVALLQLRETHHIEMIVTGDMDLVGSMTTNFMTDVCQLTDPTIKCYLPLWKMNRQVALNEMLNKYKFQIQMSCVKSPHFDQSWIGRTLTAECVEKMKGFSGLDLCGENGEYHTVVLDVPLLYRTQRLVLSLPMLEAKELKNSEGQQTGQRWWVFSTKKVPYVLERKCTQ